MREFYINGHANRVRFTKIGELFVPDKQCSRVIGDPDSPVAIDFDGGPFLSTEYRTRVVTKNGAIHIKIVQFIPDGDNFNLKIEV